MRWPLWGATRTPDTAAVQAADVPATRQVVTGRRRRPWRRPASEQEAVRRLPGFPVPSIAVGNNCLPTGVAAEQTSNTVRGTPGFGGLAVLKTPKASLP
jgi:hypothetical protein